MSRKDKIKICMIVPDQEVKGGIATVVNGYRANSFGEDFQVSYIESYCDGSKWDKFWKAVRGYGRFAREMRKNRPDIVHIHSSFGPSFWRKLPFIYMAHWKGIPIVNHIHGADFEQFYENASDRKKDIIQKVYLKCTAFIALSKEWKSRLEKIVPGEKIVIIENYCIIPELSAKKKRQILFLGEIGERKGCFDIPAIYREVLNKEENVPLLIGGAGEKENMQKLLQKEGVEDTVSFLGWVRGEEKDRLLKESGIFLFPSYQEGMPMALLEAMAYGAAIVTTNVGGIPGLIDQGVNGYICEPGDICGIAKSVIELLEDSDRRARFGAAAREKAITHYSLERHMEKLLSLYRKLLGR